jgi:hypothetical protein
VAGPPPAPHENQARAPAAATTGPLTAPARPRTGIVVPRRRRRFPTARPLRRPLGAATGTPPASGHERAAASLTVAKSPLGARRRPRRRRAPRSRPANTGWSAPPRAWSARRPRRTPTPCVCGSPTTRAAKLFSI